MRLWGRPPAEVRALARISRIGHWQRLAHRRRRRLRLSRVWVAIHDRWTQLRRDGGILAGLVRDVLFAAAGTAALVAAVEAIATAGRHTLHWGMLFLPADPDSYVGFVGAAVGAEAALLALFVTTVGVIASTAYNRVPGEIRQLFVREPTSLIYVWNVAVALLVGLVLLTMPLVAHRWPHGLTVLLFAVLTAFSVVSLVVLGTRLFNFFDLSTLSLPLRYRFLRGVRAASAAGRSVPREAQQQAAHDRAATVLRIYGQLTDLIQTRDVSEGRSAERIALELIDCWHALSAYKPAIPTKSKWYSLAPSHPNWLTLDHAQLSMALATSTSAQPAMMPDPLWAENIIAGYLGRLLLTLSTGGDWERAIRVLDSATELIVYLAARLQVDEARLLRRTIMTYVHDVLSESEPDTSDEGPGTRSAIFRMAVADRAVLIYTRFWLGLIRPFENVDSQRLASSFDKAVATVQGPYKAGASRQLLEMYERIASGIGFEQRTEHQRVTPGWWVHHVAARTLSQVLITAIQEFFAQIRAELIDPLAASTGADATLATIQVLDCLELVDKLTFHLQTAEQAVAALKTLRHAPTKDERWPETPLPGEVPAALAEQLYSKLGQVAFLLDHNPHDSTKPDLFGQSYRLLFNAAFHSLLESRTDLARQLFPITLAMADRARARLSTDLASQGTREQVIFGSEPLLDMMELSGYALLMSELDAPGIWPEVRALWDGIFAGDTAPALARHMSSVLSAHENLFALTTGGIARTERKMALAKVMREHGIADSSGMPGDQSARVGSAIVGAFTPYDPGFIEPELIDLFIAEYLKQRADMAALDIPRGAERLQDSLNRRRQRQPPTQASEAGGTE